MQNFIENLEKAIGKIRTADHMLYTTYPLVKEKRLLLKIISETNAAALLIINSILQYEYIYKRIILTRHAKTNLEIFVEKCAPRYGITIEETKNLLELFATFEKHIKSPMEFTRGEKVIILSENMEAKIISVEKAKLFMKTAKSIAKKTAEKYKNSMQKTL